VGAQRDNSENSGKSQLSPEIAKPTASSAGSSAGAEGHGASPAPALPGTLQLELLYLLRAPLRSIPQHPLQGHPRRLGDLRFAPSVAGRVASSS